MITAEFWLVDSDYSKINRIKISGHSGYSVEGSDIVCSSVSTAVILTSNLLEKLYPEFMNKEKKECIEIDVRKINIDDVGYKVLKNFLDYILELKIQYPDYVKVLFN